MAISDADIKKIISDPNGMQLLVEKSEELALDLKNKRMTTSQIRALFGEVRQIEAEWDMENKKDEAYRRLILLRPKMAYRARKERGEAVPLLVKILDKALVEVTQGDESQRDLRFRQFVEFFEAILAYHKAHGGN
jgi:CRISPR-associated protein Csm2